LASLLACSRSQPTPQEVVPAVKTVTVRAEDAGAGRILSGMLVVGEETRLGFSIGGKLLDVPLREGDTFAAGQEIARLDPADLERELAAQKARLAAARSRLAVAEEAFRRESKLAQGGIVSRAQLERALAAFDSARSDARVAEVAVADAEQRLQRTRLIAPRDGIVTRLLARRFEEIAPGQTVYEVGAQDAIEVSVLVPEQLVPTLAHEAAVSVTIPGLGDARVGGRILEIGAVAEAGNAFRIKARLDRVPPGARSGMTAAVALAAEAHGGGGHAVPLSALVFERTGTGPVVGSMASLFVLDEAAEVVRRREVTVASVTGNRVLVGSGLEPGQQVVVAGVALLRDGQKARRWTPPE
jgi:RND family efflux transporter MFP subunit